MKKTLATLALFIAGFFLVLGTQPDTVYSAPYEEENEEIQAANICGLVHSAKPLKDDAVLITVEIFAIDNTGADVISTKAIGTFYGRTTDESCSSHLRPNNFMCFDFSESCQGLWVRNCVAPN